MAHPALPSPRGSVRAEVIRTARLESVLRQGSGVMAASLAANGFLVVVALRNGGDPAAVAAWFAFAAASFLCAIGIRAAWRRNPERLSRRTWWRLMTANAFLAGATIGVWYWTLAPWDNLLTLFLVGALVVASWMGAALRFAGSTTCFCMYSLAILLGPATAQIVEGGQYRTMGLLTFPLAVGVALVHWDLRSQLIDRIIARENLELLTAQQAAVLDAMAEPLLTVDRGRIGMGNSAFLELMGSSRDAVVGRSVSQVIPELADPDVRCDGSAVPAMLVLRDGTGLHLELRGRAVDGHADHQVWICTDVTERVRREREMQTLASHDDLTGLLNRRALHDCLAMQFAGDARPTGVLLIDLDGFKEVNDRYGHESGDRVLSTLTARLRAGLTGMVIGRIGGDEFVIAVPREDHRTVEEVAELVCELCRTPIDILPDSTQLSASVGGVMVARAHDVSATLRLADAAMYRAKQAGGDRWIITSGESAAPPDAGAGDRWRVVELWDQVS